MKRTWLVALLAVTMQLGCGSDDEGTQSNPGSPDAAADVVAEASPDAPGEAGQDAPLESGSDASPDAPAEAAPDAATEAAPDAPVDAPADTAADTPVDTAADAPVEATTEGGTPWDAGNRPPGQCRETADCPGTLTCVVSAPGGLCSGCGTAADCPDPSSFECVMGTCQPSCSGDDDCPWGYRCVTSVGTCGLIACASGCPEPYVCEGTYCRRPKCASTPPSCPDGTTCGAQDYCVENQL